VYPVNRCALRRPGLVGIACVLVNKIVIVFFTTVDTDDDALRSEALRQRRDKPGICQGRRVDRNFVCAFVQHVLRVCNTANTTRNAEGYVEYLCDRRNPASVDASVLGARRDVIENEFVGTLGAIPLRQFENVAHDAVIAKLHALDNHTVADIQAGDYALCRNDATSIAVIAPSSIARPVMAAGMPFKRSCCRSSISRTPPDACSRRSGYRRSTSS